MIGASPEKAGVGGSTPSLATIKSITYTHPKLQSCPFCPKKFSLRGVCLSFSACKARAGVRLTETALTYILEGMPPNFLSYGTRIMARTNGLHPSREDQSAKMQVLLGNAA